MLNQWLSAWGHCLCTRRANRARSLMGREVGVYGQSAQDVELPSWQPKLCHRGRDWDGIWEGIYKMLNKWETSVTAEVGSIDSVSLERNICILVKAMTFGKVSRTQDEGRANCCLGELRFSKRIRPLRGTPKFPVEDFWSHHDKSYIPENTDASFTSTSTWKHNTSN